MENELILLSDYLENTKAELEFILLLEEEGLIATHQQNDTRFIYSSQINDLERFVHLHYDLAVNIEGIDIINNLLGRMQSMHDEMLALRRMSNIDFDDLLEKDFFDL